MQPKVSYSALIKHAQNLAVHSKKSRRLAINKGEMTLPIISKGTGLTKKRRPAKPDELSKSELGLMETSEEYWKAKWIPGEFEGKSMIQAVTWANQNSGCNFQVYQHIHWYAEQILQLHERHSENICAPGTDVEEQVSKLDNVSQYAFQIATLYTDALWKTDHEKAAIDGRNIAEGRKAGSSLGGSATKMNAYIRKREFDRIALANVSDWCGLSPARQIAFLKKLVQPDDRFKLESGTLLSDRWFKERLSDLQALGKITKALKRP